MTSVGVNPAADRAHRMRMYFLAMSLRVVCIVSLFWVRGFWIILAALGAVVLPYVAVLLANAVSHAGGNAAVAPDPLQLTGTQPAEPTEAAERPDPSQVVIVVDEPAERRSDRSGSDS